MKFKVGDKVRIREFKDEYRYQGPGFIPEMQPFCGEEFFIENVSGNNIEYKGWSWYGEWLELVEEIEEEEEPLWEINPEDFEAILCPKGIDP